MLGVEVGYSAWSENYFIQRATLIFGESWWWAGHRNTVTMGGEMLSNLVDTLRHLFIPQGSNNHRAKLLYPQSLAVLAGFLILANSSIRVLAQVSGGVLGYASNITISQVLDLVNYERKQEGLGNLSIDESLSDAARRKAADMLTDDYWAHVNPKKGTGPWYFFDAVNYSYRYAGENLARDFGTTEPMVRVWMDSPTHRENIMSPRYEDTGIAVVNGRLGGTETTLVVQLFGTRQTRSVVPAVSARGDTVPQSPESQEVLGNDRTETASGVVENGGKTNMVNWKNITPLSASKAISLSTLGLIVLVLLVDGVLTWKNKTHRLVGRNWAHLLFVTVLIIVIGSLQKGLIK